MVSTMEFSNWKLAIFMTSWVSFCEAISLAPDAIGDGIGLENGAVHLIIAFFQFSDLLLDAFGTLFEHFKLLLQFLVVLDEPFFGSRREIPVSNGHDDDGGNNGR